MTWTFRLFLDSSPALRTLSAVCATFSDNVSLTHYPLIVPHTLVRLWSSPSAVLSLLDLYYSNLSHCTRLLAEVDGKGQGNWDSVERFERGSDICNQMINLMVLYKVSHGRLLSYC